MLHDPVFTTFVVAILTSIPGILLAFAALWKVLRNDERVTGMERRTNGQAEQLVRRLVQDAYEEGTRAGVREYLALATTPPPLPVKLD